MHINGEVRLTTGQYSETGRKQRNEDCLSFFMPLGNLLTTKGAVSLIADGVSTAEAGGEAAELCVREFINDYFDTPDIWTVKKSAQRVLTAINRNLYGKSHEFLSAERGYICTLSIIIIKSHTAHLFHIGDSRIYRLRAGELELLTIDHITPLSESNSCLSRAMGMDTRLEIDYRKVAIEPGDVFLLSTDGVHDYLSPERKVEIINQAPDLHQACIDLTEAAHATGSPDNLSCQLVRIDSLPNESLNELTDKLTQLPFPPELSKGMKIDGYKVERELYASTRSQLYLVSDMASGQELVMKTPSQNFDDDPAYIERFIMEEWVGSRIKSPYVVEVITPNRPKNFLYYLMEKVEGTTLEDWIEESLAPSPAEAIGVIKQIALGLEAFHQKETLHQDLKPSNVMITEDLKVKIVDFGSVFVAGVNEIFVPLQRDRILGTVNYSDPVFRLGANTGIQGDIFSLAAITYEMFTKHLPYGVALEKCEKQQQLRRLSYVPADRYNEILPEWFDRALEKGLEINTEKRYNALQDFMQDLTHPNPEFLIPREEKISTKSSMIFWQILFLVWFVSTIALVVLFLNGD
ncbi:bifunctional protein-serine/threonine kinase/phosphatase [Amphritea balenae]|uniref:Bifunctional protein-serine/threonine kinase/phosphatase n=1 Tax=Amphritea balenae TaxID=452629 RepID=A0A3P1SWG1_9GAMM|nr:bifunctional protein-serine/threonine kinase/phosphatase [Amphritea balenae]RRD00453.1 bifunctional protein-serine/threonine kinase/phosphatase [Amphritea balenae]GGK70685.1 protein kinase [Amphritea balenae]